MSTSVVLLFSGQGAQKVGMGSDLIAAFPAAAALFAEADQALGFDLTGVMAGGPAETLTRTSYCQPALYLHGLAVLAVLRDAVPSLQLAACAGLSLGEFTAHAAAGTFSFADGLRLVAARGRFMDEACAESAGAMAAMIGGDEAAVRALAAECDVDVANLNAPGQIVLSGSAAGIARAVEGAKARGIRLAKPLQVAGAYHSRLMQPAREKLAVELAATAIGTPSVPVIANVTASAVTDPADIRRTLEDQVTGSVRWSESMQLLRAQGHELFLELGPGGVLAGLMGRIDKTARVLAIEDVASLEKAVAELTA
jgi:[acyl-carrier-protein] S-malonyltransferase